jgi:hypothetical protein
MKNLEIKKWVEDPKRKYKDGVALYDKYGSNKVLKQSFQRKESSFTSDKLEYEIKKIAGMDTIIVVSRPVTPEVINPKKMEEINKSLASILNKPSIQQAEPHPDLIMQGLKARASKLFTERALLSNKLRMDNLTDTDRKNIIEEMKPIERNYYLVQGQIKSYEKDGKAPDLTPDVKTDKDDTKYSVPDDAILRLKALTNARSRLSKAKKKLTYAGESSPKGNKLKNEIDKEQKFIKHIESIITG